MLNSRKGTLYNFGDDSYSWWYAVTSTTHNPLTILCRPCERERKVGWQWLWHGDNDNVFSSWLVSPANTNYRQALKACTSVLFALIRHSTGPPQIGDGVVCELSYVVRATTSVVRVWHMRKRGDVLIILLSRWSNTGSSAYMCVRVCEWMNQPPATTTSTTTSCFFTFSLHHDHTSSRSFLHGAPFQDGDLCVHYLIIKRFWNIIFVLLLLRHIENVRHEPPRYYTIILFESHGLA